MYKLKLEQKQLNNLISVLSEDIIERLIVVNKLFDDLTIHFEDDDETEYFNIKRGLSHKEQLLFSSSCQLLDLLELNNEYHNPFNSVELSLLKNCHATQRVYDFINIGGI